VINETVWLARCETLCSERPKFDNNSQFAHPPAQIRLIADSGCQGPRLGSASAGLSLSETPNGQPKSRTHVIEKGGD